jgi:hypothetical protein
MNPVPRKLSDKDKDLVAEFLKNGGAITKGKTGAFSNELGISNNQWGQRRPKQKKQEDNEE